MKSREKRVARNEHCSRRSTADRKVGGVARAARDPDDPLRVQQEALPGYARGGARRVPACSLWTAKRVGGKLVSEAPIAELYELRDRVYAGLQT
jgi:hypothetical protein